MKHPFLQQRCQPRSHSAPSAFFSSGLADHALRLGPYMRRSGKKKILHGHDWLHAVWQIENKQNPKNTKKTQRHASPPARFAHRHPENSKATAKGARAKQKQPQKDCHRTQWCQPLCRFFFRPTPSRLSPGRFTSLYLPEINCEKHAMPSIGEAAKESECGPLHSPYSCPSAVNRTNAKQNKTKTPHTKKKQTKRHTTKNQGNWTVMCSK